MTSFDIAHRNTSQLNCKTLSRVQPKKIVTIYCITLNTVYRIIPDTRYCQVSSAVNNLSSAGENLFPAIISITVSTNTICYSNVHLYINSWNKFSTVTIFNPLRPTAIQKLLEIIGRVRLYPSCSFATALDSDMNQTTGSGGHLNMWENQCMHAAVCLLRAGQPRSAGNAAKLGQFIGQFSWVTGNSIGLKGLMFYGDGQLLLTTGDQLLMAGDKIFTINGERQVACMDNVLPEQP